MARSKMDVGKRLSVTQRLRKKINGIRKGQRERVRAVRKSHDLRRKRQLKSADIRNKRVSLRRTY